MADQPPPSAGGAPNSAAPGIPHYEKLRRELRDTIQKKRNVDQHLVRALVYPSRQRGRW